MQEIKLEEVIKESLPKESFHCYLVCNHTAPTKELLETIISSSVKEIDFCGKFSTAWEKVADDVCVKYENDGSRKDDLLVITCNFNLDQTINSMSVVEEIVEDEENNLKDVLIYDDELLKNYIIKRINQEIKLVQEDDRYITEEEQKMSDEELEEKFKKEKLLGERVELDFHTNKSKGEYITESSQAVRYAKSIDLAGIAICDKYSVQGYPDAQREISKGKKYQRVLYGMNINGAFVNNINIIAKNQKGKKAIYEYLTHCFTSEDKEVAFEKDGVIWQTTELQQIIDNNRENLLIGLAYHNTAMAEALIMGKDADVNLIREDIANCDYVEVAPICAYKRYYPNKSDDEIKTAIKLIISTTKEEDKLVVATSAPQYASEDDYLAYSILYEHNNNTQLEDDYDAHIYTTEEMKYAMDWLNDDALVNEIVVTNTHKVMDMCEDFKPFDNKFHMPYVEDAYNKLESRVTERMMSIYGPNVDRLVTYRLETELKLIKDNDCASIYMLTAGICDESRVHGYKHSYRGSIGATLVGYLLGITECNPLYPHTLCPNCHRVVLNATVTNGYDIINHHECYDCGHTIMGDGHNIPYQTFMSLDGSRVPDIDLNLDPSFNENIADVIKKVAPGNKIIRAGTIMAKGYKKAAEIVEEFAGGDDSVIDNELREGLINAISGIMIGQGKHTGGYIIIPEDIDVNDITPLMKVDGDIVTHFEYHDISDNFYKADCLEHIDQTVLRYMESLGLNLEEININDQKIYELLNTDNGTLGIPEFGSSYVSYITRKIKPKKFSDLIKISGFAHGTHVWTNNVEDLLEEGIPLDELLACRDDIYNTLYFKYNLDEYDAYSIMERVRKGKGLKEEHIIILREHNVPEWFITSCNKIQYMFPKAHTVAYIINALKFAWIKIYKPAYFYVSYFNFRTNTYELDTMCKPFEEIDNRLMELGETNKCDSNLVDTLCIASEMARRGIKLINRNAKDDDTNITFEINPDNDKELIVSSPTI